MELDPGLLEPRALALDVGDSERDMRTLRRELLPERRRIDEIERHIAGLELGPTVVEVRRVDSQLLAVEPLRPLHVLNRNGHEVRPLHGDQPTEPSIWSWISRFISTAYSSGSSFVIGSTKPDTTIADASDSDRPRDIR